MNDAERMKERVRDLLRSLAAFSDREGRRILLLVPLLVALSLLFLWLGKPKFERSFALWADAAADSARRARCEEFRKADAAGGRSRASSAFDSLFAFDPNTAREDELILLGFTSRQAAGILHYREAGAVFRRAEDFSRCYTVSDEMYRRLEPYIEIGAPYRDKRTEFRSRPEKRGKGLPARGASVPFAVRSDSAELSPEAGSAADVSERPGKDSLASDSLFAFDPNTVREDELIRLGFTPRQAAGILHYREAGAVFRRAEDFSRCYTVSDEMYRQLESYIRIGADVRSRNAGVGRSSFRPEAAAPLELNSADSAALVALRGIGPLTAGRIVRYRERLGGYACVEQLQEIEGMTDRNYRLIEQQIFVDSSKIKKIDINFALPNRMKGHPYIGDKLLDRILKYRQLKGGWRSIEDLTEQHILTAEQAERLLPYLCFRTK